MSFLRSLLLPKTKPSPIPFGITSLLMVIGFALNETVLFSGSGVCEPEFRTWVYAGLATCFATLCGCGILYCRFASKIKKGVGRRMRTNWRDFLFDPVSIFCMCITLWEVVWTYIAFKKVGSSEYANDRCAKQLYVGAWIFVTHFAALVLMDGLSAINERWGIVAFHMLGAEDPLPATIEMNRADGAFAPVHTSRSTVVNSSISQTSSSSTSSLNGDQRRRESVAAGEEISRQMPMEVAEAESGSSVAVEINAPRSSDTSRRVKFEV